jgi:hypothetical protein
VELMHMDYVYYELFCSDKYTVSLHMDIELFWTCHFLHVNVSIL